MSSIKNHSSIYYQGNSGYSQEYSITEPIKLNNHNKVKFDLKGISTQQKLKALRFDPIEGEYICISNLKVTGDSNKFKYVIRPLSASTITKGNILFLTKDPQFELIISNTAFIQFEFDAKILNETEVFNLIMPHKQIFTSKFFNRYSKIKMHNQERKNSNYLTNSKAKINEKETITYANNKQNIIVAIHEGSYGGASLLGLNIVKEIKKMGYYKPIVILLKDGPLKNELEQISKVYCLYLNNYNQIPAKSIVDEICKDNLNYKNNVALINSVVCGSIIDVLKDNGYKTISLVHELTPSIKLMDLENSAKNISKHSDKIIFASNAVRDDFINEYKADLNKCLICPQGIFKTNHVKNYNEKKEFKNNLCSELSIPNKSFIVIGTGSDTLRKGLDLFTNTAAKVINKNSMIHFVWIRSIPKEMCDNDTFFYFPFDLEIKGFSKNFHLLDFNNDYKKYISGSDLYFSSARVDPFPSTILDSISEYTPVMCFENSGGAVDILADNRGFIVPYANTEIASNVILDIYKNSKNLENVAYNALKEIKNYSMDNYLKTIFSLI